MSALVGRAKSDFNLSVFFADPINRTPVKPAVDEVSAPAHAAQRMPARSRAFFSENPNTLDFLRQRGLVTRMDGVFSSQGKATRSRQAEFCHPSAVYGVNLTGDEPRFVGGEECDQSGNLFWPAGAGHRGIRQCCG
jgi:hypothetical protein